MTTELAAVLAILAAYLVGSVDFAVVVARMHGVDIHQVGSGNPGAANVLRTLGRGPAATVLVGDMLKGVVSAGMGMLVDADPLGTWAFVAGLAAVVGHCYPVFHRFKGGKGVATAVGVVAITLPVVAIGLGVLWGVVVAVSGISSLGSMVLAIASVPLAMWGGLDGVPLLVMAAMFLLVMWRHRGNVRRMLAGEERRVRGR